MFLLKQFIMKLIYKGCKKSHEHTVALQQFIRKILSKIILQLIMEAEYEQI